MGCWRIIVTEVLSYPGMCVWETEREQKGSRRRPCTYTYTYYLYVSRRYRVRCASNFLILFSIAAGPSRLGRTRRLALSRDMRAARNI